MSRTNIDLDDGLIKELEKITKIKTKKELVDKALREFYRQCRIKKFDSVRRKGVWEGNLDEWRKARF